MAASHAAEISRRLERAANAVDAGRAKALAAAALESKDQQLRAFAAVGVHPRSSVIAGRPWRGVRFDLRGRDKAIVKALGPIHFVDNPTQGPKWVEGRLLSGRGSRGKTAVYWSAIQGGRPVKYSMPAGTPGKGAWPKGVKRAANEAPEVFHDETKRAIGSALLGR